MSGLFIVIEGPDGSGSTKHCEFLAERLRKAGHDVLQTAEPTHGLIGSHIRTILHGDDMPPADALQLLFCADRAEHVAQEIAPALAAGQTVVCDRYVLSTIIYGAALGLDEQWLLDINMHFPMPDLTIITLPPFDACLERIAKREEHDQFEHEDFQRTIHQAYAATEQPASVFVDTSGPREDVAQQVWEHVEAQL